MGIFAREGRFALVFAVALLIGRVFHAFLL
jgi:hypothetical protein